jgi:hypothetical protein
MSVVKQIAAKKMSLYNIGEAVEKTALAVSDWRARG